MKKLFTLLCMIACIFLLPSTARAQEALTEHEQQKLSAAETTADSLMNVIVGSAASPESVDYIEELTGDEVQYILSNENQVNADGNAFKSAVTSFQSGMEKTGAISSWEVISSEIDGDSIIILLDVTGADENAQAEIIVSNDMFCILQSATLNPVSNMGARMVTAAMNTAIGLTTVFTVLIIIIVLISCFTLIPKIQAGFSKKKEVFETAEPVSPTQTESLPSQTQIQPATIEEDTVQDEELVAVIAAAIAASEGMLSPEGLVVRSIRRVKRA